MPFLSISIFFPSPLTFNLLHFFFNCDYGFSSRITLETVILLIVLKKSLVQEMESKAIEKNGIVNMQN